ncbi:MAG: hypothetical protein ACKVP3_15535 [Hyphomicrobiaceae bacterium]
MADAKPFNRDAAKQQPELWFASPMDIVGHRLLTRGEKIVTLERWRLNLLGELAAANEGMRTRGYSSTQLAALDAIEEAKSRLRYPT